MAALGRRAFLVGSAVVIGASARRATAAGEPIVETASGKLRGAVEDGMVRFLGVPYGAPTGGRNRFMPPQKPEPWSGVRSAEAWAGHAPQSPINAIVSAGYTRQQPEVSALAGPGDPVPQS